MRNQLFAGALISAVLAVTSVSAHAQQIVVTAPAQMSEEQNREWSSLEKKANRLAERITDREGKVLDEQGEVASAQAKLAKAESQLREEERELERANDRLADARQDLDKIQERMIALGGSKTVLALQAR